jgi:hypothetical protein
MSSPTALDVVERQLSAYNERDLEAYCGLFASDAFLFMVREEYEIARGRAAIRDFYQARFTSSPELQCEIVSRIVIADLVIDHERVTGIGPRVIEIVAVYEVRDGLIHSVRFLSGTAAVPPPSSQFEKDV